MGAQAHRCLRRLLLEDRLHSMGRTRRAASHAENEKADRCACAIRQCSSTAFSAKGGIQLGNDLGPAQMLNGVTHDPVKAG